MEKNPQTESKKRSFTKMHVSDLEHKLKSKEDYFKYIDQVCK